MSCDGKGADLCQEASPLWQITSGALQFFQDLSWTVLWAIGTWILAHLLKRAEATSYGVEGGGDTDETTACKSETRLDATLRHTPGEEQSDDEGDEGNTIGSGVVASYSDQDVTATAEFYFDDNPQETSDSIAAPKSADEMNDSGLSLDVGTDVSSLQPGRERDGETGGESTCDANVDRSEMQMATQDDLMSVDDFGSTLSGDAATLEDSTVCSEVSVRAEQQETDSNESGTDLEAKGTDANTEVEEEEEQEEEDDDMFMPYVIEIGSGGVKAGLASDKVPRCVVSTDFWVRNDVPYYWRGELSSRLPFYWKAKNLPRSFQRYFDRVQLRRDDGSACEKGMEALLRNAFAELEGRDPDRPILLTVAPDLLSPAASSRLLYILFEQFHAPACYIANAAVLAIPATGRLTGLSVCMGASEIHVVPVYDCFSIQHAAIKLNFGGNDIDEFLQGLLGYEHSSLSGESARADVQGLKERVCRVALDFDEAVSRQEPAVTVDIRNGQTVTVGEERYRGPELLFRPSLNGKGESGLHDAIYTSIMKCDPDIREELFGNIVLSGGSSMFPGLAERLHKEMEALAPKGFKVGVIAAPDRKIASWVGGSIIGSLRSFLYTLIFRSQYQDYGVRATSGLFHFT